MATTTIQVDDETADRLHERKRRGETYDDVCRRLLNETDDDLEDDVDDESRGFDAAEPPEGQLALEDTVTSADEIIDGLDLPGSGATLEARREAVRACYNYLCENRDATKSDFVDDIYPDHRARYGSSGGWWNAIGKQGLRTIAKQHPTIDAPGEGERLWRSTE